jgi:hypothetical protein
VLRGQRGPGHRGPSGPLPHLSRTDRAEGLPLRLRSAWVLLLRLANEGAVRRQFPRLFQHRAALRTLVLDETTERLVDRRMARLHAQVSLRFFEQFLVDVRLTEDAPIRQPFEILAGFLSLGPLSPT